MSGAQSSAVLRARPARCRSASNFACASLLNISRRSWHGPHGRNLMALPGLTKIVYVLTSRRASAGYEFAFPDSLANCEGKLRTRSQLCSSNAVQ